VSFGVKMLGVLAVVATASFAMGAIGTGTIVGGAEAETFGAQHLERDMSVEDKVELFIADIDRVLRADSILYKRWKALNPVEAAEYEEYVELVGKAPTVAWPRPVMRTPLGRALTAAASIAAGDPTGRPRTKTVR
jgi:hypothetical protein